MKNHQVTIDGITFSQNESRLLVQKIYSLTEDIEDENRIANHDPEKAQYHDISVLKNLIQPHA